MYNFNYFPCTMILLYIIRRIVDVIIISGEANNKLYRKYPREIMYMCKIFNSTCLVYIMRRNHFSFPIATIYFTLTYSLMVRINP